MYDEGRASPSEQKHRKMLHSLLGLEKVWVWGLEEDETEGLRLEVATVGEGSACPGCGTECDRVWERRSMRVRDLESYERKLVLEWLRRRFVCNECGKTHFEVHPEFAGEVTTRRARWLSETETRW